MSSGLLNITVYGMSINGEFLNGKLIKGKLQIANIIYDGTYDNDGLLSGQNCSMEIDKYKVCGEFEKGVFLKGCKINNEGRIVEKGEFTMLGSNKIPYLTNGIMYTDNGTYEGEFNRNGDLLNGTMYINDSIYKGKFISGKLIQGEVVHLFGKKKFTANYIIERDMELNTDVFKKCKVNWDGNICDLPMKLIIMLCCAGEYSCTAHRFYLQYLSKFDGKALCYLTHNMFGKLSPEYKAGLSIIIDNLRKYDDYIYNTMDNKNKIRRTSSENSIYNLVDKHYSPREYFNKDH